MFFQDCVRVFPEACKAWTVMIAALIDRLRSARKNFGCPLSLRGSGPCLNKTTMMLNSVSLSRNMSPMRRPSSPCAAALRHPSSDSNLKNAVIESKPVKIVAKVPQHSIV